MQWYDIIPTGIAQLTILQVIAPALLLLFIEESGIILMIPGDIILAYMGYEVANTAQASLILSIVLAIVVVCAGASILFLVSRRWGHHAVTALGNYLFISDKRMRQAKALFKKYGFWAVLVGRHIPGLRVPITIFAGASGMSYRLFLLSTVLSIVPWVILFMQVGHFVGHQFHWHLRQAAVQTAAIIICAALLVISVHYYRARQVKHDKTRL